MTAIVYFKAWFIRNIEKYAKKVHAVGGRLGIDSTFAPPPLQYPFKWGADLILHSGKFTNPSRFAIAP